MPDWSTSMQQTFEYYIVDPETWKDTKKLDIVKSSTISRDSSAETLGSATMDITGSIDECYVRTYLITIQNGIREKHPLGTHIVQTPSVKFDGKVSSISVDAYTPLLELKDNKPPIGYYIPKNENIMDWAYSLTQENARAPIVKAGNSSTLFSDFVANTDDTWLTFLTDLVSNANYTFDIDDMGRILFSPKQDTASLQPIFTYNDDNSSILYSDLDISRDLYGIPNVVEVIYSGGSDCYYAKAINDEDNSPISTVNRGREIVYRVTNPDAIGTPTEKRVKQYAEQLLKELSTLEYTITYSHGYNGVRVGDCVRMNYSRAGITNIKAKVINQSIDCTAGCKVSETATFTTKLWR